MGGTVDRLEPQDIPGHGSSTSTGFHRARGNTGLVLLMHSGYLHVSIIPVLALEHNG